MDLLFNLLIAVTRNIVRRIAVAVIDTAVEIIRVTVTAIAVGRLNMTGIRRATQEAVVAVEGAVIGVDRIRAEIEIDPRTGGDRYTYNYY